MSLTQNPTKLAKFSSNIESAGFLYLTYRQNIFSYEVSYGTIECYYFQAFFDEPVALQRSME